MTAVRITLVGEVSVVAANHEIGEERLAGRQGRLLFAYLVTRRGHPVPREDLADVLWSDSPPATWDKALSVLVSKLRAALAGTAEVTGARGYYRLDLPGDTWVDADAAEDAARGAAAALVDGRPDDAITCADAALAIVRKPFLPGDESTWAEAKRRELADVADEALACLVDAQLAVGRTAEATKRAEEAIGLQPFRETGYRRLMQAHAAAGNRAEALRVYDRCRRLLLEELGAYPSPETEAIFQELLKEPGRPAIPVAALTWQQPSVATPPRKPRPPRWIAAAVVALAAAVVVVVVSGTGEPARKIGSNSVAVLDAASGDVVKLTTAERGYGAIATGASDLWAADSANSAVIRLDRSDGSVRDTIPVGLDPAALVAAGDSVWVANAGDGTLSRISPERGSVVQTIGVGNGPTAVAAGAGSIWVANRLDSTLARVDARTGRLRAMIPLAAAPTGVAFSDGWIWVSGEVPPTVSRIDPASNQVAQTISVGQGAEHIAPAGRSLWVTNGDDRTVSRIDTRTNTVRATVDVGGVPLAVAVAPRGIWVARDRPAGVVQIDPARARVVHSLRASAPPVALAAAGNRIWVATGIDARHGGTLRLSAAIDQIDPAGSFDYSKWSVLASVYDGLVGYRRVGGTAGHTIVPDLARSLPSISDGGRTYRFELRDGLRFSNGRTIRASDFKHTFERVARLEPDFGYFRGIRSIDADDANGTLVLRLSRPDPEFVNKLALPVGWVVPSSMPMRLVHSPPPATGPYRIDRVGAGRLVLVRNPVFRPWSAAAQPPGHADRIVVAAAPEGQELSPRWIDGVDLAAGQTVSPSLSRNLVARYASRIRTVPLAASLYAFLNTHVPPFDDVRVRQAVNYAVDRAAATSTVGGPLLAQPTCQALPPGLTGYRPYCPYTRGSANAGVWAGPDAAKGRRLVAAAGRRGHPVTVWTFADLAPAARELAGAMRRVGLRAGVKVLPLEKFFAKAADTRTGVQASTVVWVADTQTPYGFLTPLFDCKALQPANPANANYAQFCDSRSQRSMDRALAAQTTDLGQAGQLWARADRAITDAAPVVPLATLRRVTVLSPRVRGYQYNPVIGPLLSQMSVR
jgi:peptide/nickel transport system substrate-binding protein